ncbi:universal stress protein PHOS32 [Rhodamnia argentea]|uniref:Universal stress protein PHOS32 n=1 Tax=Rhodamnia argentea TaxID=178133 RepID=A0A8B8Q9V5_9MYRT|nr:universal stress protein PHOS32 [Rhodamnia argentea]
MGRTGTRLPGFCLNRIRPHVRVRSPPTQSKPEPNAVKPDRQAENPGGGGGSIEEEKLGNGEKPGQATGRRIMIVVDSSIEAKGALQWALSHTVQSQDIMILLHVTKPAQQGTCEEFTKETAPTRAYQLVQSLKNMCQLKRPEVQIETVLVQGKEKGPKILEEARKSGASLLVMGQKKRSVSWRLLMMWVGGNRMGSAGGGGGVVEYCIQNAECMAIAVRRKSKKLGGYLITTKRQKDFWLLA